MRITDLSIKALKAPENGAQIYYDDVVPGFGVRVSRGGTKSFVLTHGKRRRRQTIGRVGIVSLQEARLAAKTKLAEYTLGKTAPRSISWATALSQYIAQLRQKRRQSTCDEYGRSLNRHFPFRATTMNDVTADELERDLDRIKSPSEKRHAYVYLRAFLRWAHRKNYIEHNPIERVTIPAPGLSRERILSDDEIKKVWQAAEGNFAIIVKLLLLTGQRVGEVQAITKDMVQGETVTFPGEITKNGKVHKIPVTAYTAAFLPPPPFNNFSNAKRALDAKSGVTDWTLHDLRRTFASGLQKLGVRSEVIEALLNHTPQGIRAVYQRHPWTEEKISAVKLWNDHLQKLLES